MQQRLEGDSSGEDEGFMPNRIVVENISKQRKERKLSSALGLPETCKERPTDFQPRYICGVGLIKKEPVEAIEPIEEATVVEEVVRTDRRQKRARQRVDLTAYQLYFKSKTYRMVYSRTRERRQPEDEDNFTSLLINLDNAIDYDSNAYSQLKSFDLGTQSEALGHTDLMFDSRFESGNLAYAFRRMDTLQQEYDLFIQSDINTVGYCQWFYFSLRNMKSGCEYRLNLVNFKKRHSLFQEGMKPAVFSMLRHRNTRSGWTRDGTNITYARSKFMGNDGQRSRLYTLSFSLWFEQDQDYVLVAMNLPYSYSRLMDFIKKEFKQIPTEAPFSMRLETIAYTLSNNAVPLVMIEPKTKVETKRLIIVSARQHSGETWSSYLMEGILKKLVEGSTETATYLLNNFTFAVFPMINVDGVIYGNFRCDIGGVDLNRQWSDPHPLLHPQVHAIRRRVEQLAEEYQIEVFLDLHGHSKKLNTFCYSCKDDDPYSCRVLPLLLSKYEPSFELASCTFGIDRWKENTARAFLFLVAKKVNMLTIENSFFGTKKAEEKARCYQPSRMNEYAGHILKALAVYFGMPASDVSLPTIEAEIKSRMREFYVYDQNNQYDSGSESDPYADEMDYDQKINKVFTKRGLNLMKDIPQKASQPVRLKAPKPKPPPEPTNKSPVRNTQSPVKHTKQRSMSIRHTSMVPKIGRPNEPPEDPRDIGTIDVTKIVQESCLKAKTRTTLRSKLQRSSNLNKKSSYRHQSIDSEAVGYAAQTSFEIQNQQQRLRLAQLTKNRYQANATRNDSSSSEQTIMRKRHNRQPTKMPRVAILNDSIEETMQRNHPVLVIMSDKKKHVISGGASDHVADWGGHNLFPIRKRDKTSGTITYEKFKQRSQRQRSNLVNITRFWRQNVDRYSRELQAPP